MVISETIDIFFSCCFALEALIKSTAFGFVFDDGSYLRESWNQLDFFIVVTSIIDLSISSLDISVFKVKYTHTNNTLYRYSDCSEHSGLLDLFLIILL